MDPEVQEPVRASCEMKLCQPQSYGYVLIVASLYYSEQDPYAVRVTFRSSTGDDPVVWYIGRDLLRDGLVRQTGEGDIQVSPDPESAAISIRFKVDNDSAALTAQRRPVESFLRQTAEAVPYGRESKAPGFVTQREAALARLLTGS
ncbi:SsgA family sporulation/cell division regulator [Streptomyces sp. NBC_00987]|uniref:SsgA family sporulation/cell division regulator n=1 Tax=Streptomyces sp. NBC_00987 TaxID=2903703 RepID=UPI00386734D7|nr:SsgA family sporulation/cell division regulator [Streptomyces sp. NBC_00987]